MLLTDLAVGDKITVHDYEHERAVQIRTIARVCRNKIVDNTGVHFTAAGHQWGVPQYQGSHASKWHPYHDTLTQEARNERRFGVFSTDWAGVSQEKIDRICEILSKP